MKQQPIPMILAPSKNENLKKELHNKLKEWLKMTKAHGPDRLVVSGNTTLTLVWLSCLIISTGLCSYLISKSVMDFFKHEVKTRIEEVYAEEVPFPQVSICNNNPLVTQAANDHIKAFILNNYNVSVSNYSDLLAAQDSINISVDFLLNYIQYMTNDPDVNTTVKQSFGSLLSVICSFNNNQCDFDKDMIGYFDPVYGNCFNFNPARTFNGTKRKIYTAYRPNLGLSAAFFLGPPDDTFNYMYENFATGLVVTIDDQEVFPLLQNGILVKPGTNAQIVITRTETNNLPEPYGSCMNVENIDTILSREMKKLDLVYSRRNCLDLCEQKSAIDIIGCNSLQLPRLFNAPYCTNLSAYGMLSSQSLFNLTTCSNLCPIECVSVTYDSSISYLDFPTYNTYLTVVHSSPDFDNEFGDGSVHYTFPVFKKSFSFIQVIYKEIKYTEITETPSMTWVDLIAAIGGTMGLFLGLSVMVFVEIIELIIEFLFIVARNCSNSSNKVGFNHA
jgi:hypothetical protein